MINQVGSLIKEARVAAGMTQKELADKVEGLSAYALSKAERDEKELTPEQLKAIADATGVSPESLMGEAKENEADAAEAPAVTEEEVINLFKAADPAVQKAAVSLLKGEQQQAPNPMDIFMNMLTNGDIINKVKGFLATDTGKAFMSGAKNMLGGAKNIFGGQNNNEAYGRSMSVPLMAFTYFYTISHYILLLSFYFWLWRKDIKPSK